MTTKKTIGFIFLILVSAAVIADTFRYLQPRKHPKFVVNQKQDSLPANANEIIMVYNANGGVFPGIADVIHKTFAPGSYPCNLCLLAFGNFGKKGGMEKFFSNTSI